MLLGPGLFLGLAAGAAAGGWGMLTGLVLAGAFAALVAWFPPHAHPVLRGVALVALAVLLARTLGAYLLPADDEFVAVVAIAACSVFAAFGADVPVALRRALAGLLLMAAAAFVAISVAIEPAAMEPAVYRTYPVGWLVSGAVFVALFTTAGPVLSRRAVLVRIAIGTAAAVAVGWAALYQLRPVRLGLSDAPLRDALAAADAAALATALNAIVLVTVLPALLAVLAAARDALGSALEGPPVRFAVTCGVAASVAAVFADGRAALGIASAVTVAAALAGWLRRGLDARRRKQEGTSAGNERRFL